ncbi:hypothetical protein Z043_122339 [Scleropages formosus]|uniref:Uncharacterized protein n=1 Tax=Scleropages formosus TaxID=113540 RepID=A0A0P7Y218_SCLFO|nr:hypothetical protein Z043_122339 [Scleropages formosus]
MRRPRRIIIMYWEEAGSNRSSNWSAEEPSSSSSSSPGRGGWSDVPPESLSRTGHTSYTAEPEENKGGKEMGAEQQDIKERCVLRIACFA